MIHTYLILCTLMMTPRVILIFLLLGGASAELTILRQPDSVHCIASGDSGSSALAWVSPFGQLDQVNGSTWRTGLSVPRDLQDAVACDLALDRCDSWIQGGGREVDKAAVEGSIPSFSPIRGFGPVLDHRWENFQMYKTNGNEAYSYKIPVENQTGNNLISMHFSVLTKDNAFLVLHGGEDPHSSPTYWVVIDGWNGITVQSHTTVIRKCDHGVPITGFPTGECHKPRASRNNTIDLSETEWTHISIQIRKVYQTLRISLHNAVGVKILDWTDQDPINVKVLSFRTDKNTGYWKFHQYKVLTSRHMEVTLPKVQIPTPLCLSVVHFSHRGQVFFQVTDSRNSIARTNLTGGIGWQVQRIEATLGVGLDHKISFTHAENFYIGDIRLCSDKEVHISTLLTGDATNAKCTQLKTGQEITYGGSSGNVSAFERCRDQHFGAHCNLTCDLVLSDPSCHGVSACDVTRCSCLEAGFSGEDCLQRCPGFYGPRCLLACGHCLGANVTCHPTTGDCGGCAEGWRGPRCDKRCDPGTFGADCSDVCGHCLRTEPCVPENGFCPSGCEAGWAAPLCYMPPEKVQNLTLIFSEVSNARISWTPPLRSHGVLKKYIIKYQHKLAGKVGFQTVISTTLEVTDPVANLPLTPDSIYTVSVAAFTVLEGHPETIEFSTAPESFKHVATIVLSALLGLFAIIIVIFIVRRKFKCCRTDTNQAESCELQELPHPQPIPQHGTGCCEEPEDHIYDDPDLIPNSKDEKPEYEEIGAGSQGNQYDELGPIVEYDDVGPPEARV